MEIKFKIKVRAYDPETGKMITEESSGLSSGEILCRYATCTAFMGMVDVYGGEIYEGDILHDELNGIYDAVTWDKKWQFHTEDNLESSQEDVDNAELRIAGNVFQHASLLVEGN